MTRFWTLCLITLFSSSTIFANPFPRTQELDQIFETVAQKADEARNQNRMMDAIHYYKQAVSLQPEWTEGWWYLATSHYELDQYEEAINALNKVLKTNHQAVEAWSILGLCEFQMGKYSQAFKSLQRAIRLGVGRQNSFALPVRYHLAILLNQEKRFEEAARILGEMAASGFYKEFRIREALGISALRLPYLPRDVPSEKRQAVLIAGRAMAYISANIPASAEYEIKKLVRLYPGMENVHYIYGNFLAQTEPDRALSEYKRELEISPEHLPAILEIVFEYLKQGSPNEALPFAEKAISMNPDFFPALNAIGRTYLELDRIDEAIQHLEKGVRIAPNSPEMHFSLARAYQKAGRKEDAQKSREEFTRLKKLRDEGSPTG